MLEEVCLVIVKPGAQERGLCGQLIMELEEHGFQPLAVKWLRLPRRHVRRHYRDVAREEFFPRLLAHMTSGPVAVVAVKGDSEKLDLLIGTTDPATAHPSSLRYRFGAEHGGNITNNGFHSSAPGHGHREARRFWIYRERRKLGITPSLPKLVHAKACSILSRVAVEPERKFS